MLSFHSSATSEQKEAEIALFPTQLATDPAYPFVKEIKNFKFKSNFAVPEDETHHRVEVQNKVPKMGKDSSRREQKDWFFIKTTAIPKENFDRLNHFIVAAGEIYRFEIGSTQPKYRIARDETSLTCPISEGVPGFMPYEEEIQRNYYSSYGIYEGMGRVIFNKYLYLDDDMNLGNICVNKNKYFIGIDHDFSFGPLTVVLRNEEGNKYACYDLREHSERKLAVKKESNLWRFSHKPKIDMGSENVKDYDSLPYISYYLPRNWALMTDIGFAKRISQESVILNEKHFSALKALSTSFVKRALINIHIENETDRNNLQGLVADRLTSMQKIVLQSKEFVDYVKLNRIEAIKVIMYEMLQFLNENKHYQYSDKLLAQVQWDIFCKNFIKEYSILLEQVIHEQLNEKELLIINQFARNIFKNESQALADVKLFYMNQNMTYRAKQIVITQENEKDKKNEIKTESKKRDEVSAEQLTTKGQFSKAVNTDLDAMDAEITNSKFLI